MTSETGFLRRFIVTRRKNCRNRVYSYLCVGYETFRSNGKNHSKIIIKNGFPRYSQLHRKLPTKVRCTPRGNYRQRLGSAENSTCWIGKSIALSVADSPKIGDAEIAPEIFYQYQELTARYSGALCFLQTQHHSATSMLANSDNEMLKSRYSRRSPKKSYAWVLGFRI